MNKPKLAVINEIKYPPNTRVHHMQQTQLHWGASHQHRFWNWTDKAPQTNSDKDKLILCRRNQSINQSTEGLCVDSVAIRALWSATNF